MHIAHILRCMAERMGGPPKSVLGLGQATNKYGTGVSYWSAANEKDLVELSAFGADGHFFPMGWPQGWFRSSGLARELKRQIAVIDILHVHGIWSHPHYIATKIGRQSATPYILAPRGELEPWRVKSNFIKHVKKRVFLTLLGRTMLQNAACLQAITPKEIDGFRMAGYKGPVTVVPNGIDAEIYAKLPDKTAAEKYWPVLRGRRVILFLSRISWEKGLPEFLLALARLIKKNKYSDVILVIAGPDERGYHSVIEALIEKYQLRENVLLTGMVREEKKKALMAQTDIYTLPSYAEGFSVSLLESLSAGKPVLITPGCNFPEVAEVGAGLCVSPNPEALAEGLLKLLDMSQAERENMGHSGRALVFRHYSWDTIARKMMTVYRCILEGREVPLHPEPIKI